MKSSIKFTFKGKPLLLEEITPDRIFDGVQLVKVHGSMRFADPNLLTIENYSSRLGIREDLREHVTLFLDQTKPPGAIFVDDPIIYSIIAEEIDAFFYYASILEPSDLVSHSLPSVARARTLAAVAKRINQALADKLPTVQPRLEVRRFSVHSIELEPNWSPEHLARIQAFKETSADEFRGTIASLLKILENLN